MFWYCFRERDLILDLFEMVTGVRMHTRYFQVGGLAEDIPRGFYDEARKLCERMPKAVDEYEAILNSNRIWLERTKGIGPALRRRCDRARADRAEPAGLRRRLGSPPREPYLAYDQVDFDGPVYYGGDVYDRYKVRVDEMRESTSIIAQCVDRLEEMQGEPWIADDRKVVLPPREELHTSMESLIHHFKIVTEGYRVPEGEVYVGVESPRGSRVATSSPTAARSRGASSSAPLVRRPACDRGLRAGRGRRRPDRRRRLTRRGHGRRRPMSAQEQTLYDEIQKIRVLYPVSAPPPCLRFGSRRSGTAGSRRRRSARSPTRSTRRRRTACRSPPSTTCTT
jgi:hypothetical protein